MQIICLAQDEHDMMFDTVTFPVLRIKTTKVYKKLVLHPKLDKQA